MAEKLVTTVVGSYPQPDWLVNRENLQSRLPPRVRAREIWRIPAEFLEQAQEDATLVAIRDMERAGVDIITDGEIRRESYSNRFATALEGVDLDNHGTALNRAGEGVPAPRITGPIRRPQPIEVGVCSFYAPILLVESKQPYPAPSPLLNRPRMITTRMTALWL